MQERVVSNQTEARRHLYEITHSLTLGFHHVIKDFRRGLIRGDEHKLIKATVTGNVAYLAAYTVARYQLHKQQNGGYEGAVGIILDGGKLLSNAYKYLSEREASDKQLYLKRKGFIDSLMEAAA